nr:hypothetical protein [uncultured archaeon]
MKIAFFEIHPWEKSIIKRKLKKHRLVFINEPLTEKNAAKAKDAEVISIFIYSKINHKIIKKLPKLKLLITRSTGFDHIKIGDCRKRKIIVCYRPNYGENTVAEHTFALILSLSRKIHKSYLRTLSGNFGIEGLKGTDLEGKTIGVLGAGKIGKHVIRIARGFNMKVIVNDRHEDEFLAEQLNFKYVSLKEILKKSDILTIHIPYSKENYHLINAKTISQMKKGAMLINTSRGEIVDTGAVIKALDSKKLSGVGLDVIEGEILIKEEKELLHKKINKEAWQQIVEDHTLLSKENVVFTPHIAFYSKEALHRIIDSTIQNIKDYENGKLDESYIVC